MNWKTIPNYNKYEACKEGFIRTHNWKNTGQTRIMKPAKDNGGYLRTVLIRDDGKYHTVKIHRIIAKTFIDNPERKATVNHKDFNKQNNNVNNLEWMTNKENTQHAIDNGKFYFMTYEQQQSGAIMRGELNGHSLLNEKKVKEIREKFKPRIYTRAMLSKEYGVTENCIKDVVNGKSWKHLL